MQCVYVAHATRDKSYLVQPTVGIATVVRTKYICPACRSDLERSLKVIRSDTSQYRTTLAYKVTCLNTGLHLPTRWHVSIQYYNCLQGGMSQYRTTLAYKVTCLNTVLQLPTRWHVSIQYYNCLQGGMCQPLNAASISVIMHQLLSNYIRFSTSTQSK